MEENRLANGFSIVYTDSQMNLYSVWERKAMLMLQLLMYPGVCGNAVREKKGKEKDKTLRL